MLRNDTIDSIRGFSIIIMVFANSFPYVFPEYTPPYILRTIFSIAAPLFIFLSGVSLQMAHEAGKSASKLAYRAFQILVIAIIIDFAIWRIIPLTTMDVLYLLSFSLLIMERVRHLNLNLQLVTACAVLMMPLLTFNLYEFDISEDPLNTGNIQFSPTTSLRRALFDGWFPLMPWFSFVLIGYYYNTILRVLCKVTVPMNVIATSFLAIFIFLSIAYPHNQPPRNGYLEIFYPVTARFYLLTAPLIYWAARLIQENRMALKSLALLGKVSLPIYIFHIVCIALLIPIWNEINFSKPITRGSIAIFVILILVYLYAKLLMRNTPSLKEGKLKFLGFFLGT
jgi:uncharacterized membrane protein